ncbi:hypothetical protein V8E36_001894 [Tilletia maclaganii]
MEKAAGPSSSSRRFDFEDSGIRPRTPSSASSSPRDTSSRAASRPRTRTRASSRAWAPLPSSTFARAVEHIFVKSISNKTQVPPRHTLKTVSFDSIYEGVEYNFTTTRSSAPA